MRSRREIEVLLIEDNPADARLVREIFSEWRLVDRLHHAIDGVDGMAFLRREGIHADSPRPNLVLLDLNLPRLDGREVLRKIKSDPKLRDIPVLAHTTSVAQEDVNACYEAGANAYVTKPLEFADFVKAVHALETFWFSVVTLPEGS